MPKVRTITDLLNYEAENNELRQRIRERADELAILRRQLKEDPLTTGDPTKGEPAVYNRRKDPEDCSYVVVFVDGDHFGKYNKFPGNTTFGDSIIKGLAHILQSNIRSNQYRTGDSTQNDSVEPEVIRPGGDEFMLRLYGCTENAAPEVTERIRSAVQTFDWKDFFAKNAPDQLDILAQFRHEPFMTISIGYAFVENPSEEQAKLGGAEKYMQMAKQAGGNGVGNILAE